MKRTVNRLGFKLSVSVFFDPLPLVLVEDVAGQVDDSGVGVRVAEAENDENAGIRCPHILPAVVVGNLSADFFRLSPSLARGETVVGESLLDFRDSLWSGLLLNRLLRLGGEAKRQEK